MRRRLIHAQDFIGEIGSVGELDPAELPAEVDVAEVARNVVRSLVPRTQRTEVEVEIVQTPTTTPALARTAPRAVMVLLRELVAQAVSATPRAGKVTITVTPRGSGTGEAALLGTRVVVDDEGSALPASARRAFLGLELDPGTYGRPSSIPLYVAAEIAAWQGALLELGDSPSGGLRAIVTFPRG